MSRLAGKVAIVTGAGEGIGRSIAQVFAEQGAAVGILELNADLAQRAAEELAGSGAKTSFYVADVSDEDGVRAAVDHLAGELGPPTVLVNNAGNFVFKGLDATPEEWRESLAVNVIGLALVSKHVVPHMQRAGGGAIVNLASISAWIAQPEFLTYSATKGAVLTMTKCMALDLADSKVRVNSISPGGVWSSAVERFAADQGWTREEAERQPNLGANQIIKRAADPREIALAVLYLASDEASFVTGANLMVDGGWSAI